jgi:hypothetical protein
MRFKILFFMLIFGYTIKGQSWNLLPQQQEELGFVNWSRSYEESKLVAVKENKPIFILFQEVPGCSTCKSYGKNILTHPHIKEAIETYFVPLVIFNNKGGKDAAILSKFNEPSWNNPVVRIIDNSTENDIVNRLNGRYGMAGLIETIENGILASNKLIPEYLALLRQEFTSIDLRETHLAMYCFWSGEKNMGNIEGVIETQAGFMNGSEVVKIIYDADKLDEAQLLAYASEKKCADALYSNDQREISIAKKLKIKTANEGVFRADSQPKYYIFKTTYKDLPMTGPQALKANAALSNGSSPDEFLSPRQLEVLILIENQKIKSQNAIDKDFTLMWNKLFKNWN